MVATTLAAVALVAVKEGRFPVSGPAASPMDGVELVQEKVVPVTGLAKVMAGWVAPLQMEIFDTAVTVGVGFTVMVNDRVGPTQVLAVGVTTTVPLMGAVVVFVAVNTGIEVTPLIPSPIVMLELVHEKDVPATGLLKLMAVVVLVLHHTWFTTAFTVGVGFTVMVKLMLGPVQPLAEGTTVMLPTMGVVPVLVAVKEGMFPLPPAPRPMAVLSLVQEKVVPVTGPPSVIMG